MRHNICNLVPLFFFTWAFPCTMGGASEESSASDEDGRGQSTWNAAIETIRWTPVVKEVGAKQRPRRILRLDGPVEDAVRSDEEAYRAEVHDGNVAFEVMGKLPHPRTMIWAGVVREPAPRNSYTYFCLRYRACGIERSRPPVGLLSVTGRGADDKPTSVDLLTVAQVLNDDRWHLVVGKKPISSPIDALRVKLTTSGSLGRFEVSRLSFHDSLPQVEAQLAGSNAMTPGGEHRFECLDLGNLCNDECAGAFRRILDTHEMVVDGGNRFDALTNGRRTIASGIPFEIPDGKHNLIRPPENPKLNAEEVDFLGIKTTRHYCRPHGRDDLITLPVDRQASEVFFVMAAELPPSEFCYARPPWPRPVDDIETLAVELAYADGKRDFAFPYSLADEGFRVRRALGAYVVPADPERVLTRFILHNRLPNKTFSLAAVTINTSSTRAFPRVLISGPPIRVPKRSQPPQRAATIRRDGDLVRLSNTYYDLVIDCSQGFSLRSLNNCESEAEILLDPSSGIEVEVDDTILTGRAFQTESVQVDGCSVAIRLQCLVPTIPLRLLVRLDIDGTSDVTMNLTAESTGTSPLDATVRFPVLRDLTIGECDDSWMFFPKYRNVISNRHGTYYVPNDCRFPVQVFDIYNPRAGAGLGVITHNRDHRPLDYSMGKTARGVFAFVQSPGELYTIAPGGSVTYTESCLVFHQGDWHEAVRAYRDWLATLPAQTQERVRSPAFRRPSKQPATERPPEGGTTNALANRSHLGRQQRDWFRRVFLLRCHQTKKFYSWAVPIYEPENRSYRIDDFVHADTDYLGMYPQIFHLFGWIDLENGWRGHPNGDFRIDSYTGGPRALKMAIRRLQDQHGIVASLYTLSDRCYKKSEFGLEHGERAACRRQDGSAVEDEFNWYLCGNSKVWRDQYVESLCRTQRETGVKVLYVDVFPFSRSSPCYSPDHGHEVPSHVNRGTFAMIRQLRESLPDDVVIWSEYPLPDTALPYIDGNIHYYCFDWHEHFGKTYDRPDSAQLFAATAQNVYRYIFPRLKQFIFPCGVPPWSGDSKFPFFNGEALYGCAWNLYAGANLDRIKKALAIQRKYDDCFASLHAIPEVSTEQREVHANCFPGHNRIAWTLFNARYTTVRGPVLAVKHRPGATYHDAWNDAPLAPDIVDDRAVLMLTLHPQQLGCVVQTWKGT